MVSACDPEEVAGARYDALIVGAGVIGSGLAWQLAERGLGVLAIDLDLAGPYSSSERNAGGVRATWWQGVNIGLCQASIGYYEQVRERVGFQQSGYLWMHGELTWNEAVAKIPFQNGFGLDIEQLSPESVTERLGFVDRLEGVRGATFSPRDGLINPNLLKEHYRDRARERGARFLSGARLESLTTTRGGFAATLGIARRPSKDDEERPREVFTEEAVEVEPERVGLEAGVVVNAAGAWAPRVARLYGGRVPTKPVRRQISLVACREVDLAGKGMIVDPTGLYFHAEGQNILAGYSPPDEPAGYRFNYDGEAFFLQEIWPRLHARSSRFERVRHLGGWAGLYALTPDRSAILGGVAGHPGIFESHGYSGRGVMQSYGAGVALAELIATGRFETLDAAPLSGDRYTRGELVHEALHI